MKKTLAVVITLCFLFALVGTVLAVSDVVDLSAAGKAKVVKFGHKAHDGYAAGDCKKCHHTGENVACKTCHDDTGSKANGINAKTAFHKQCKDCHKAGGKGPTTCAGCHTG